MFDDAVVRDWLTRITAEVAEAATAPAWSLPTEESVECLRQIQALESVTVALKAHLVRELDGRDVAGSVKASSMVVWLRDVLRITPFAAKRLVALGRMLDDHPALDAAASSGAVNPEQAMVIAESVDDLPREVGPDIIAEAEQALIGKAAVFEPVTLRRLGSRILTHVAPDIAERAEALLLARQEERAHIARAFSLAPLGDGRVRLSGLLPAAAAATVTAVIDPLSKPNGAADDRSPAQRRADALLQVFSHGGEGTGATGARTQVVVTTSYDALRRQLGTGTLDSGDRIGAEEVRLLACDAQIIPAVLSTAGQVLDLGHAHRLVNAAVRRALHLRDGGCSFPGCDRPPQWTDAHHVISWTDGGPTSLGNLVLLCRYHHGVIHRCLTDPDGWRVRMAADGLPEFIPPPHVDPQRRPMRNRYHWRL